MRYLLFLIMFMAVSIELIAQPGNPSSPTPFGLIELLALGGIGYGAWSKGKKRG